MLTPKPPKRRPPAAPMRDITNVCVEPTTPDTSVKGLNEENRSLKAQLRALTETLESREREHEGQIQIMEQEILLLRTELAKYTESSPLDKLQSPASCVKASPRNPTETPLPATPILHEPAGLSQYTSEVNQILHFQDISVEKLTDQIDKFCLNDAENEVHLTPAVEVLANTRDSMEEDFTTEFETFVCHSPNNKALDATGVEYQSRDAFQPRLFESPDDGLVGDEIISDSPSEEEEEILSSTYHQKEASEGISITPSVTDRRIHGITELNSFFNEDSEMRATDSSETSIVETETEVPNKILSEVTITSSQSIGHAISKETASQHEELVNHELLGEEKEESQQQSHDVSFRPRADAFMEVQMKLQDLEINSECEPMSSNSNGANVSVEGDGTNPEPLETEQQNEEFDRGVEFKMDGCEEVTHLPHSHTSLSSPEECKEPIESVVELSSLSSGSAERVSSTLENTTISHNVSDGFGLPLDNASPAGDNTLNTVRTEAEEQPGVGKCKIVVEEEVNHECENVVEEEEDECENVVEEEDDKCENIVEEEDDECENIAEEDFNNKSSLETETLEEPKSTSSPLPMRMTRNRRKSLGAPLEDASPTNAIESREPSMSPIFGEEEETPTDAQENIPRTRSSRRRSIGAGLLLSSQVEDWADDEEAARALSAKESVEELILERRRTRRKRNTKSERHEQEEGVSQVAPKGKDVTPQSAATSTPHDVRNVFEDNFPRGREEEPESWLLFDQIVRLENMLSEMVSKACGTPKKAPKCTKRRKRKQKQQSTRRVQWSTVDSSTITPPSPEDDTSLMATQQVAKALTKVVQQSERVIEKINRSECTSNAWTSFRERVSHISYNQRHFLVQLANAFLVPDRSYKNVPQYTRAMELIDSLIRCTLRRIYFAEPRFIHIKPVEIHQGRRSTASSGLGGTGGNLVWTDNDDNVPACFHAALDAVQSAWALVFGDTSEQAWDLALQEEQEYAAEIARSHVLELMAFNSARILVSNLLDWTQDDDRSSKEWSRISELCSMIKDLDGEDGSSSSSFVLLHHPMELVGLLRSCEESVEEKIEMWLSRWRDVGNVRVTKSSLVSMRQSVAFPQAYISA